MDNMPKIAEELIEWFYGECDMFCCNCDFYPEICDKLADVICMIESKKIEGEE